jgi:outer membrane protein TolC
MALYKQGATDYLTVVTSQTTLLQTQLQALTLDTLQLSASVALIRALGGGWESPSAPPAVLSDTGERLPAHGT